MYLKVEKENDSTFVVGDVSAAELVNTLRYEDYLRAPVLSVLTDFASEYDMVYESVLDPPDPQPADPLSDQFGFTSFAPPRRRKRLVAKVFSTLKEIHVHIVLKGCESSHTIPVEGMLGLETLPGGITQSGKLRAVTGIVSKILRDTAVDRIEEVIHGTHKATRLILKGYKAGRETVKFVEAQVGGKTEVYVFDTKATLYADSGAVLETWE